MLYCWTQQGYIIMIIPVYRDIPINAFFSLSLSLVPKESNQRKGSQFEGINRLDPTLRCELAIAPVILSGQSLSGSRSSVLSVATATAGIFRE